MRTLIKVVAESASFQRKSPTASCQLLVSGKDNPQKSVATINITTARSGVRAGNVTQFGPPGSAESFNAILILTKEF